MLLMTFKRMWLILCVPRWLDIWLNRLPERDKPRVFYGHDYIPQINESASGGIVKFQRMQDALPNSSRKFNILYMVSSAPPIDWKQLVWLARQKRAKVVWNQNGVGYRGWHGPGWEHVNRPMAVMLKEADYVFYQSHFCKVGADLFAHDRQKDWEVLYNAVDTRVFTPSDHDPDPRCLVLLLGGNQYQFYRLERALQTLSVLTSRGLKVKLLVTGKLNWLPDESKSKATFRRLILELGIVDHVEVLGTYAQRDAPAIMQRAHLLLHTKYNDPCPGLVAEAMACGLPVVYSHSGGVPELVGEDAGIGIPAELNWDQDIPPDPNALAEAVQHLVEHRARYSEAARQRAVDHFDLRPWIQRHIDVFEECLSK
jgi:glycosyltransferase involved in cell wall biosynthesis